MAGQAFPGIQLPTTLHQDAAMATVSKKLNEAYVPPSAPAAPIVLNLTFDFPGEILEHILCFLLLATVGRMALVCTRLEKLTHLESLWHALYLRDSIGLVKADTERCWREAYRNECHKRFEPWFEPPASKPLSMTTTKLLMVGDSGVGKTSFMVRFNDDTFNFTCIPTIGIDFRIRRVALDSQPLKLMLWHMAGPEHCHSITSSYYRDVDGIFIMFDVGDRSSFEHTRTWLSTFRYGEVTAVRIPDDCKPKMRILLLGLKADAATRNVSAEEGLQLAARMTTPGGGGVQYAECSSLTGIGVENAVQKLVREICDARERSSQPPVELTRKGCRRIVGKVVGKVVGKIVGKVVA